jgi:hypothetical protein
MTGPELSGLDELREHLREAARRDVEARRVRRRRRRRTTSVLAALVLGGAAAAGAADLISVGEPATDLRAQRNEYKPPAGTLRPTILVRAKSGLELPYAVGAYDARGGKRCLIAGSLLSYTLGVIDGDEFRPYRHDKVGACDRPDKQTYDTLRDHGNTLVFGRASAVKPTATVIADGKRFVPPLAAERSFLLVFKGTLGPDRLRVVFSR